MLKTLALNMHRVHFSLLMAVPFDFPVLVKVHLGGSLILCSLCRQPQVAVLQEAGREFDEFVRIFERDILQEGNVEITMSVTITSTDFNAETIVREIKKANTQMLLTMIYPAVARKLLCEAIKQVL